MVKLSWFLISSNNPWSLHIELMLGRGEEELTRIPWLILTQLIVLFLLFALLFFFTLLPFDPDHDHHNNLVTADIPPPTTTTSSTLFFFDDIQIHQIDSPLTNHDSSPTHPTTTLQVTHFFSLTKIKSFCYFTILIITFTPRKKSMHLSSFVNFHHVYLLD